MESEIDERLCDLLNGEIKRVGYRGMNGLLDCVRKIHLDRDEKRRIDSKKICLFVLTWNLARIDNSRPRLKDKELEILGEDYLFRRIDDEDLLRYL